MAKCKSCGQDMAEHVNFCSNCGAASGRGQEGTYTDEQVQDIAKKLAKYLRTFSGEGLSVGELLRHCINYMRDRFEIQSWWTYQYVRPVGLCVDADVLTMKQKAILTKVVGKAMKQVGKDYGKKPNFKPLKVDTVYGMSISELEYSKEQGRMDTIIRAINNKR